MGNQPENQAGHNTEKGNCHHCDACESTLKNSLYCSTCQRVQALGEEETYFSIFNQPVSFQVDPENMQEVFDELIVELHPDFHTQGDDRDQELSLHHTALLHEARDGLLNPFERGKYLLKLLCPEVGLIVTQPSQMFLIEMFELQEDLDALEQGSGKFAELQKTITEQTYSEEERVNDLFKKLQADPKNTEAIEEVKEALARLKFLLNLKERFLTIKKKHG